MDKIRSVVSSIYSLNCYSVYVIYDNYIHAGRRCEVLTIKNGDVTTDLGFYVEGALATYTCKFGYELITTSNLSRVCQSNGQWNGTDPMCLSKDCMGLYTTLIIIIIVAVSDLMPVSS